MVIKKDKSRIQANAGRVWRWVKMGGGGKPFAGWTDKASQSSTCGLEGGENLFPAGKMAYRGQERPAYRAMQSV